MKNWPSSPFHEYQCNKMEITLSLQRNTRRSTVHLRDATDGQIKLWPQNVQECCVELQRKSTKSSACSTADRRLPKTGLDVTDGDKAVTGE